MLRGGRKGVGRRGKVLKVIIKGVCVKMCLEGYGDEPLKGGNFLSVG